MDITQYVAQYLQQGYSPESIRDTLRQSGYSDKQINAAFNVLSEGQQPQSSYIPSVHSKQQLGFIAVAVVGVLLLLVAGILVIGGDSKPVVPQGGTTYEPVDEPQVTEEPEPDVVDEPVVDEPTEPEQTPDSFEEPIDPNEPLSGFEIDALVRDLAPTEPERAIVLCAQKQTTAGLASCTANVAFLSEDWSYCDKITEPTIRDTCYMSFAYEGIGSTQDVCTKIINEQKQRACSALYTSFATVSVQQEQAAQLQAEYAQVNSSLTSEAFI